MEKKMDTSMVKIAEKQQPLIIFEMLSLLVVISKLCLFFYNPLQREKITHICEQITRDATKMALIIQ